MWVAGWGGVGDRIRWGSGVESWWWWWWWGGGEGGSAELYFTVCLHGHYTHNTFPKIKISKNLLAGGGGEGGRVSTGVCVV